MAYDIKPLLKYYDAFGWIPTIRAALSLNLMGKQNKIWGDVDRYAVEFIAYNGLSSERFIVATSLHNVSDSKYGEDFIRTFRYFFYGSIHDPNDSDNLICKIKKNSQDANEIAEIKRLVTEEGVLIGRLIIVLEDTANISEREVRILKSMQELVAQKKSYNHHFSILQSSLNELESKRKAMKTNWDHIKNEIDKLKDDGKRQFQFEVLLTRDGILLLKDDTEGENKSIYFEEKSPSDYTMNVPIHRIFKTAMNFMKFLFHTNYHHEEEHDTFLPASNLHPFRNSKKCNGIIRHQLNAFLNPLISMRRKGMKQFNIDPIGIINYAKSFVHVCKNNKLLSEEESKHELQCISLLEDEINHTTRHHKSLLSSIATQRNWFFVVTTVFAFVVAILKIFESGLRFSQLSVTDIVPKNTSWYNIAIAFAILVILGFCFFGWSSNRISKRDFHITKSKIRKNKFRSFLFNWDSDLVNAKFSFPYRTYIKIQDYWYNLNNKIFGYNNEESPRGKINIYRVKFIFWIAVAITGIFFIIKYLI